MFKNHPSCSAPAPDKKKAEEEGDKEKEDEADPRNPLVPIRRVEDLETEEEHIFNLLQFLQPWPSGPWSQETRQYIATALLDAMQSYTRGIQKGMPHVDHADLPQTLNYVALVEHAEALINNSPYPALWKFVEFHEQLTEAQRGIAHLSFHLAMKRKLNTCRHVILHIRPAMHAIQEKAELFQLIATEGEHRRAVQPTPQAMREFEMWARRQRDRLHKARDDERPVDHDALSSLSSSEE